MNAISRKLPTATRIALGLLFAVFGLNKVLHFLPQPPMSGPPGEFFGALWATGYMLPLIAATEVTSGVLLLAGRFIPLALTLLAPVLVNILAFHVFLAPAGIPVPLVALAAEIYLAWSYRDAFAPMLRARVAPHAQSAGSVVDGRGAVSATRPGAPIRGGV
ncbi:MAG TPA: DoxX family membrane protein [Polyangiaceae bacterium]|nr:DoxX family membrane protein [Polyangiaceae bacterium]